MYAYMRLVRDTGVRGRVSGVADVSAVDITVSRLVNGNMLCPWLFVAGMWPTDTCTRGRAGKFNDIDHAIHPNEGGYYFRLLAPVSATFSFYIVVRVCALCRCRCASWYTHPSLLTLRVIRARTSCAPPAVRVAHQSSALLLCRRARQHQYRCPTLCLHE